MYFPLPLFRCTNDIYFINVEGDNITFERESNDNTKTTQTLDTSNLNVYDSNNVNKGKILSVSDDNNIPSSIEDPSFSTNINGASIKTWIGGCKYSCVHYTTSISRNAKYGGCTGSCVGCTTCNGCYATIVSTNMCTAGCTSNCATGCTGGCTSGCTTSCTGNFEGSYGCIDSCTTCDSNVTSPSPCSFENDECVNNYSVPQGKMIVCKGCNTLCNNCTSCTVCVDNVTRQYCSMATTCTGCTTGTTLQVDMAPIMMEYNAPCKNGQNGLYEDGILLGKGNSYLRRDKCTGDVTGYVSNIGGYTSCQLSTLYLWCISKYACENNNTFPCTACFHSCDDLV